MEIPGIRYIRDLFNKLELPTKKDLSDVDRKIKAFAESIFKPKQMEVIHLGGTAVASHDPSSKHAKLDTAGYFYERVPIRTRDGQIFLYGKTLEKFAKEYVRDQRLQKTDKNFQDYMYERLKRDANLADQLEKNKVYYFGDTERAQTEIKIEGNQLRQVGLNSETPELKALKPGTYAFVIADTRDGNGQTKRTLFATPKVNTEHGKIQHSSFARGGNVVSAGMLVIGKNNQIAAIRNQSGHYKPAARELAQLIGHLKAAGYDVSQIQMTYYKNIVAVEINKLVPFIKWGIVQQPAHRWFEETGSKLL